MTYTEPEMISTAPFTVTNLVSVTPGAGLPILRRGAAFSLPAVPTSDRGRAPAGPASGLFMDMGLACSRR